jgi:hypothetical protein
VGNYQIKVIGTLPDLQTTYSILYINITRNEMANIPLNISIISSNIYKYSLPIIENIPDEEIIHNPLLPNFISFKFPDYTFSPNSVKDIGITNIKGAIISNFKIIRFSIKINVTNEAPYIIARKLDD